MPEIKKTSRNIDSYDILSLIESSRSAASIAKSNKLRNRPVIRLWTRQVCHWFTVDMMDHLRHGGRISAASAAIGTVLNIKPLLHVAEDGTLKVMDKPRGRKKAFKLQMSKMEQGWMPELGKLVVIGHGDSIESALELKETVLSKYPDAEVHIADIGPVIGAHTGPGMLALIFWGTTR